MQRKLMTVLVPLLVLLLPALPALAEEFPLRATYPQVKTISTAELAQKYDQAVIVDVRSEIEFEVGHIAKAKFIPVSAGTFLSDLEKARPKNAPAPIAFYCNGHTCAKSYKAVEQAAAAGFGNVFCYDAGIFEWITTHPERATLMGQTPAKKEKLISESALKAKKIGYAQFAKKASEANSLIIDIREPFQRAKDPELPQNRLLVLSGVRNIPSDRLVDLLKKGEFKEKQLLITDAVGKQVQWIQYYLEEQGYRNYFFLENGVLSAADAGAVK